jgi:hypothetical protein
MGMRRFRILAAGVLLVTSCASGAVKTTRDEPNDATTAAASRPESSVESTPPDSPPDSLLDSSAEPSVTNTTANAAAAEGVANSAAEDVKVGDPLPPQTDGVTDSAAADVAIRYAFQHWLLIDLDRDVRAKLVDQGELNIDALDSGVKAARPIAEFARFAIDAVRITGAESADVDFRVRWRDGASPYFPNRLTGGAVFQNGSWRVSGKVLCLLALGSGQNCSGVQARNPTVPAALRLSVVPEGFGSQAINAVMQVAVPGGASWQAGTAWLAVTTQTLVGLSVLDHDAAATMLASGRFGPNDGTALDVAGRAGRYSERPEGAQLLFVRDDDVVVTIQAVGLSAEQMMQVATGLVPDQFVPGAVPPPLGPLPTPNGDTTTVTAVTGRPLWRRRKMLLARTRWSRRRLDRLGLDDDLSRSEAGVLRDYWRRVARFEHASVPAFEELAIRLRRADAPVPLIDRALVAVAQERDHTARAVALTERFAGRELRIGPLASEPERFVSHEHELATLAVEALRDGVLNEGYAAWQASAQAKAASDPQVVDTLTVVASADPDPDGTFFRVLRSMVIEDVSGLLELNVAENDVERVP